jgi:hypothetical protein
MTELDTNEMQMVAGGNDCSDFLGGVAGGLALIGLFTGQPELALAGGLVKIAASIAC